DEPLAAHRRAAARDRGLRARPPRARRVERLHARVDPHPPAGRGRGGHRGGRLLRRGRSGRPAARGPGPAARGLLDPRDLLRPPGDAGPVARAPGARAVRPVPGVGLRVRGAGPRAAPGAPAPARRARARAAAPALRGVPAPRRARVARPAAGPPGPLSRPAVQAGPDHGLGRGPRGRGGRHGRRGVAGHEGPVQGHGGRRPAGSRALPPPARRLPGRLDRGPAHGRPGDRGAPGARARPDHLGRDHPLHRRHPRPAVRAPDGERQAVAARRPAAPAGLLRVLRRAGHRDVRRRPVRARRGPRAGPAPGLALPPRRAERRRAGRLQRARAARRPAVLAPAARSNAHRLPPGLV
ncbi:MAG: hypothetical protein AVDCRST_MAG13-2807, partial [uncultured Solirubrobacteraceae bacterium]